MTNDSWQHDEITIQPRVMDTRTLWNLRIIQIVGLFWLVVTVYWGLLVRALALVFAVFRRPK